MAITASVPHGVDPPFNNNDTAPCAAGDHCTHPTSAGIVQVKGQNYTPHKCFVCKGHIHCALYCGHSVAALKGAPSSLEFVFFPSVLSSEGQHVFSTCNEEGTTLCHTCLKRFEPECRALSASMDGSLDDIIFGDQNVVEDNSMIAGGSEETQPVTNKSSDEILKAAMNLKTITWEDIEVSAGDTCKVDKTKKSSKTKLKGFSVGGNLILTESIKSDVLQKIAHYFNVKSYRTNKKDENAIAIVLHRATMEGHRQNGTGPVTANTTTAAPVKVNLCRFANVICGPLVSPRLLSEKGKSLNKDALQEKLGRDQLLVQYIIDEYNSSNKSYDTFAHQSVERRMDPAVFEQISRDRWKEVDKFFNHSLSILEKFIQKSKLSGTHDDLADTIPTDCCDPGILYLYFSMREIEGLTNVCISKLPGGVFCESGGPPPSRGTSMRGKATGGGKKGGGGTKGGGGMGLTDALESMAAKNIALQRQSTIETTSLARNSIVTEQKRKSEIVDELTSKVHDKKKAKRIIKRNQYEIVDDSDIEIDSDDGGEDTPDRITESQGELVEQYHAAVAHINFIKSQMETLTKTA